MHLRSIYYFALLACIVVGTAIVSIAAIPAINNQERPRAHKPPISSTPLPHRLKLSQIVDLADAPESVERSEIEQNHENQKFSYAGKPNRLLDGYYSVVYRRPVPSSDIGDTYPELLEKGFVSEGLKQGVWKGHYLAAGRGLDYTETYQAGWLNGPFTVYNADRTVRYQALLAGGNGMWKSFYANGRPKLAGAYRNGREHGTWVRYGRTGRVAEQLVYEHGILRRTVHAANK